MGVRAAWRSRIACTTVLQEPNSFGTHFELNKTSIQGFEASL